MLCHDPSKISVLVLLTQMKDTHKFLQFKLSYEVIHQTTTKEECNIGVQIEHASFKSQLWYIIRSSTKWMLTAR